MKDLWRDFPFLSKNKNIIYFDSASTSLLPKDVILKVETYMKTSTYNIGRGFDENANKLLIKIEEIRKNVAKFVGTRDSNNIAFTSGSTFSSNIIANAISSTLNKEDEVIASLTDHKSLILPWLKLQKEKKCKIVWNKSKTPITLDDVKKLITPKTKVFLLTHISNNFIGEINVKAIVNYLNSKNIISILDCAQSVLSKKLNFDEWGVTFAFFSGHKMFATTGIGILYVKNNFKTNLKTPFLGGSMTSKVSLNDYVELPFPTSFEPGTMNILGIISLGAAISYIEKLGKKNISKKIEDLKKEAILRLEKIKGIIIYEKNSLSGALSFNIQNINMFDLAEYLSTNNIVVRYGSNCVFNMKEVINENNFMRISFSIFNTIEEIDKFIKLVKKFLKDEFSEENC